MNVGSARARPTYSECTPSLTVAYYTPIRSNHSQGVFLLQKKDWRRVDLGFFERARGIDSNWPGKLGTAGGWFDQAGPRHFDAFYSRKSAD